MGMIGYFAEIDSEKINQLLESTKKPLMDNIHDTLSGLRRLDIDKRWDFLHFGLTGTSAFDPAKNDPLSRAVLGEHSLEDGIDGFLGLTWNQELAATIDRLESLDRSELRKQFSIKEGANKRGNSSRLTQSFHFFMFEPIFSPVNALNQPI